MWNQDVWKSTQENLQKMASAWENLTGQPDFARACTEAFNNLSTMSQPSQWTEQSLLGRRARVEEAPFEVVWRWGSATLRHYRPEKPVENRRLFIVYAMVNRPYVLDLLPERSVIRRFLKQSYDVYLLDWGEPGRTEGDLPLDVFVDNLIGESLACACEREGVENLPLLGYCQGGTLAALYAMRNPEKVEGLALMATPVDFSKLGHLSLWAQHLQPQILVDEKGVVPGWKIRWAFENMRPFSLPMRWQGFMKRLLDGEADEVEKEHFAAMERWISDDRDLAGKAFVEFVERYYHRNELLPQLKALTVPLLLIVGEKDNLVPPESTLAALEYVGSTEKDVLRCNCGHIGLSVSGKAHKNLWPQVMTWLEKDRA